MPNFPESEIVRKAVQEQLYAGLADTPGDWIGTLPDGREIQFSPKEDGTISVSYELSDEEIDYLPEDAPIEKIYRFRIRVETV